MEFSEWLFLETVFNKTFYHGTPAENVSKILIKGLKPHLPQYNAEQAIYLTPDIQLAAKYAVGAHNKITPAILEINLSQTKRLRTLSQDPLDQSDDAWGTEGEKPDAEGFFEVQRDVENFIKKYIPNYWIKLPDYLREFGTHALNGFNVYRFILGVLTKALPSFGAIKQQIKTHLQQQFAPGNYSEDLEITPSGTFRVKPSFYNKWEQLKYPKDVPPAAIKYIWVRKSDFPKARGKKQEFGIKYLPWQAKDIPDNLINLYESLADDIDKLASEINDDDFDAEWWIKQLQKYVERIVENDSNNEFKDDIEAIIQSLYDNETMDLSSITDAIRSYADNILNDWGNTMTFGQAIWIGVSPMQWERVK